MGKPSADESASARPATSKSGAKAAKPASKSGGVKKSSSSGPGRRGARDAVLRRPPTRGWPRWRYRVRRAWRRLLELPAVWLVLFLAVGVWSLLPRSAFFVPRAAPGTIATRAYVADRDVSVPNEEATQALQEQAKEEVPPVYDFDTGLETDRRQRLSLLFERGRQALIATPSEESADATDDGDGTVQTLMGLEETAALRLTEEQLRVLAAREFSTELEDRLGGVLTRLFRQGVVSGKDLLLEHRDHGIVVQELPAGRRKSQLDLFRYLDYPEQVAQAVRQDMRGWDGLRSGERAALVDLVVGNVAPNLTFNSSDTLARRERAAQQVGTVSYTFHQGEVIVRPGERVDAVRAQAIAAMAGERDVGRLIQAIAGTLMLLVGAVALVWLASGREPRVESSQKRHLAECLLLLLLHLVGARFAFFLAGAVADAIQRPPFSSEASYHFAVPVASLALIGVLLYGRSTALLLALINALFLGSMAGGQAMWTTTLLVIASSIAAVYSVDQGKFKQRSALQRAGAVVGLVNVLTIVTLQAMRGEIGTLAQLGFDVLCGFVGGLLASAVAGFVVPILELLLSRTTSIKLIELANPNLPLLRRLALEAPGSFQHSLAVANLAKAGAEAVDADAVLIYTGALYHDIGKVFRPQYFIENQLSKHNPHDKIQPSMSALILTNHVKEGLELAHQHHLPPPILDAIEQHHGTRLIKFFYSRAKERSDPDTQAVREDDFRYPGPKPQSKEAGVLMLADAVEAASRTLVDPSRQKLRNVLQAVFEDCLRDGQLDHTDLTLGDLRKVDDAFLRVLTNIHHRRVDYPGFDFNRPQSKRDTAGEATAVRGDDTGAAALGTEGAAGDQPVSAGDRRPPRQKAS